MRTIERDIVGAFIFSKDGKILLGQSISGGVYEDQWVVPGGGIEPGETKLEAVIRETKEEVGIDISGAEIEEILGTSTGKSEKKLRDTGEQVLVVMEFFDFKVNLPVESTDVQLKFDDDLSKAQWFSSTDLQELQLGVPTQNTLSKIGFITKIDQ